MSVTVRSESSASPGTALRRRTPRAERHYVYLHERVLPQECECGKRGGVLSNDCPWIATRVLHQACADLEPPRTEARCNLPSHPLFARLADLATRAIAHLADLFRYTVAAQDGHPARTFYFDVTIVLSAHLCRSDADDTRVCARSFIYVDSHRNAPENSAKRAAATRAVAQSNQFEAAHDWLHRTATQYPLFVDVEA